MERFDRTPVINNFLPARKPIGLFDQKNVCRIVACGCGWLYWC
jgi:hypothetical protein